MEQVRLVDEISARLSSVRERIEAARRRAKRRDGDVTIVAVTKKFPATVVDAAVAAGIADVGENRVQEAAAKIPAVASRPRWHLIGHLQRNKARRALELFPVIHSVDSARLVDALDRAQEPGAVTEVFLQVNVAGEQSKYGVTPEEAREVRQRIGAASGLSCAGLMALAPFSEDPEDARPHFRSLRQLRDDLDAAGDGPPLPSLSMGMSGDFEVAVEEGATHVRIGTALLGTRETGTSDGRP